MTIEKAVKPLKAYYKRAEENNKFTPDSSGMGDDFIQEFPWGGT